MADLAEQDLVPFYYLWPWQGSYGVEWVYIYYMDPLIDESGYIAH